MPTPPSPPYSPTDVGAALVTVIMIGLTVLAGFFPQLQLDPTTRIVLVGALTVLAVAGFTTYASNRRMKTQAQTAIAVAQAAAVTVVTPAPPAPPVAPGANPFAGREFVITPVDPGAPPVRTTT